MRPVLFEDGDKDEIQLIEESTLRFETLFGARALYDKIDNEVAYAYAF